MQTHCRLSVLFCLLVLLSPAVPAPARPPGHPGHPGRGPMMHGHHMPPPPHHSHRRHGHWRYPALHRHVTERSIFIVGAPVVVAPVAAVSPDAAVATTQRWVPAGYVHHSQDEWRRAYMGDAYQAQVRPSAGIAVGAGSGVTSFVYHERRYDNFGHIGHHGHRRFGPAPPLPPGRPMHHHGPGRAGRMRR